MGCPGSCPGEVMTALRTDCPRLLSLAVHELRTPVSVATGYLRMLQQFHGERLTNEQRKFVSEAAQSCGRLGDLLADLSVLSKLMSGQSDFTREEVPIFRLAAEAAAAVAEGAPHGVRLEPRGMDKSVVIIGDRAWLQTALRSLLAATVRERIQPGTLVLECRRYSTGSNRRVVIALGDEDAAAALASLPPSRWAPFDRWRGGVGFALAIAAEVVEAHRGWLGSARGAARQALIAVALPLQP
jgi:signal transduction histidine kinase